MGSTDNQLPPDMRLERGTVEGRRAYTIPEPDAWEVLKAQAAAHVLVFGIGLLIAGAALGQIFWGDNLSSSSELLCVGVTGIIGFSGLSLAMFLGGYKRHATFIASKDRLDVREHGLTSTVQYTFDDPEALREFSVVLKRNRLLPGLGGCILIATRGKYCRVPAILSDSELEWLFDQLVSETGWSERRRNSLAVAWISWGLFLLVTTATAWAGKYLAHVARFDGPIVTLIVFAVVGMAAGWSTWRLLEFVRRSPTGPHD